MFAKVMVVLSSSVEPTPLAEGERGGAEDQERAGETPSLENSAPDRQNPVPDQQNSVPSPEESPPAEELSPVATDTALHGNDVGVTAEVATDGPPTDVILEEPGGLDGASSRELEEQNRNISVDDSHSSSSPVPQPSAADNSATHLEPSGDSTKLPQQPAATPEEGRQGEGLPDSVETPEGTAAEKQGQSAAERPPEPGSDTESPGLTLGPDLEQTPSEPSGESLGQPAGNGGEGNGLETSKGEVPPDGAQGVHRDETTLSSANSERNTSSVNVDSAGNGDGVLVDTHDTTDSEVPITVAQAPLPPATDPTPSPATDPTPTPTSTDVASPSQPSQGAVSADEVLPSAEPTRSAEHTLPDTKPSENASTALSQQNATTSPHNKTAADSLPPPGNGLGVAGVGPAHSKEKSVFIRLGNRIKDLEENMSLFSSYLEEISSR